MPDGRLNTQPWNVIQYCWLSWKEAMSIIGLKRILNFVRIWRLNEQANSMCMCTACLYQALLWAVDWWSEPITFSKPITSVAHCPVGLGIVLLCSFHLQERWLAERNSSQDRCAGNQLLKYNGNPVRITMATRSKSLWQPGQEPSRLISKIQKQYVLQKSLLLRFPCQMHNGCWSSILLFGVYARETIVYWMSVWWAFCNSFILCSLLSIRLKSSRIVLSAKAFQL